MKARNQVKQIVALGTGLAMVGATIFGASAAADLADYPNPLFIKDGKFNGIIVVGDDAVSSDVIGAIDIATALQAESVVTGSANVGAGLYQGGVGQVSVSGDVAEFAQPNDLLELQEFLGDVRETLTELDMNMLRGGVITTDEGTTDYNQYLRFEETSTNVFNSTLRVVYQEDEDDNVGDFLFSPDSTNAFLFEYELEFEEGAESSIASTTELEDLEDEIFNMLGTPFAVSDTDLTTTSTALTVELLGGAISDILEEGETKTYTIDGKEYEVNVLIISDNRDLVKFKVNGEITDELRDGETDILKDGTRMGIREILPNEAEEVTGGDLVEFYLGATEVEFTDGNTSDTTRVSGVEVNDESIEDGSVLISGRLFSSNSKYELLSLKYRLEADTLIGDLYVPPGHGIREFLDEPEGLLSPNWDIVYGGLMDTGVSILKFDSAGDDQYDLRFTTQEGLNYNVEFIDNAAATRFRVGDEDDDLLWIEGDNSNDFYINPDDTFILTDDNDETGFTHVVEYQSFDEGDNELTFTDLAGETREFTAEGTTGLGAQAELVFGGNTFIAFVGNSTVNYSISVDLNNDGFVGDNSSADPFNTQCTSDTRGLSINATGGVTAEVIDGTTARTGNLVGPCRAAVVIQGGGILDLGVCDGNAKPFTAACNATNNGPFASSQTAFQVGLLTLNSEFDENGPRDSAGDELIVVRFENRSGFEVGLNVQQSAPTRFDLALQELKENDDIERDMSDYGVLVELFDPQGSDEAEDLTLEYPLVQRGAHVFVVSGEYGITKSGPGGNQQVQKISVGAAKLASEVEDVSSVDAIVVGGPCANPAAADLMGNPEDCAEGFEPGKAMIKLYENGNNVALLVAGAEALDTRRAARVLANHEDYDLSGMEVVVSGTSLTDIDVMMAA